MQDVRSKPLAYLVQAIGLLVILANLWIASKLAPLAEDLIILQQHVDAHDVDHVRIEASMETHIDRSTVTLNVLDDKIDSMSEDIAVIKSVLQR